MSTLQTFIFKLPTFFYIILYLFFADLVFAGASMKPSGQSEKPIRVVMIDAGHGGHDSGCVGKIYKEKDITLDLALALGAEISKNHPKIKVIYTRTKDEFIPLYKRIAMANNQKADLFISIHLNATTNTSVRGTETFVMGLHSAADNLEVAKRENSSILLEKDFETNYDGYDPNSPVGHIILANYQNAFLGQSIDFAAKVEYQFQRQNYTVSRGVKQAGFVVLKRATMPSVLVEAGFLSNPEEELFLGSAEGKEKVTTALYLSFVDLLRARAQVDGPENVIATKEPVKKVEPQAALLPEKLVESKTVYRIQIAAMKTKVDAKPDPKVAKIGETYIVFDNGMYKYQVGDFWDHKLAQEAKTKLVNLGYKTCYIVKSVE